MSQTIEKARLRKQLLDSRDALSPDFINISSSKIRDRLRRLDLYKSAKIIGAYYAIGSEVRTQDIIQEILNQGKELALPRVVKDEIVFMKITGPSDLEMGNFSVMEPKERCPQVKKMDLILVPAIALTREGYRLGYGFGFYDKFLHGKRTPKIALSYAKQVVKSFPHDNHDVKMDCIVTEDYTIFPS